LVYGLTYTAMAICYAALWFYAAKGRRLIAPTADDRLVSGISRSFRPGTLIYAIATLSALISAILAVVLYSLIALLLRRRELGLRPERRARAVTPAGE